MATFHISTPGILMTQKMRMMVMLMITPQAIYYLIHPVFLLSLNSSLDGAIVDPRDQTKSSLSVKHQV